MFRQRSSTLNYDAGSVPTKTTKTASNHSDGRQRETNSNQHDDFKKIEVMTVKVVTTTTTTTKRSGGTNSSSSSRGNSNRSRRRGCSYAATLILFFLFLWYGLFPATLTISAMERLLNPYGDHHGVVVNGATAATTADDDDDDDDDGNDDDDLEVPSLSLVADSISSIDEDQQDHQQQRQHKPPKLLRSPVDAYSIPQGILQWDPPLSSGLTRTVCATGNGRTFPAPTLRAMFAKHKFDRMPSSSLSKGLENWKFILDDSTNPRACEHSSIRILWDQSHSVKRKMARTRIMDQHQVGQQLTTSIVGGYIDKSTLFQLIQSGSSNNDYSNNDDNEEDYYDDTEGDHGYDFLNLLQYSIPETIVFDSEESCHQFCTDQLSTSTSSSQDQHQQQWLWKPLDSNKGHGIRIVQDEISCHSNCVQTKGKTQVQALTSTMLLPDGDGRKFDVRSHVLVGHVEDPMVVFAGAEKIRICAEPYNKANPIPYPNDSASSADANDDVAIDESSNGAFNPFQQVCNINVGKKHPTWTWKNGMGPLSRGIPDEGTRQRVLDKIDAVNLALVDLLKSRWTGKTGMFQVFGVDYLVDTNENVWILEMNEQPGFSGVLENLSPNPWPDILEIEWEILSLLGNATSSESVGEDTKVRTEELKKVLSEKEFMTLRMLRVGDPE